MLKIETVILQLLEKEMLTKHCIQKCMYLLQEKVNVDMNLRFYVYSCGMFSNDVAFCVDCIEDDGLVEKINVFMKIADKGKVKLRHKWIQQYKLADKDINKTINYLKGGVT